MLFSLFRVVGVSQLLATLYWYSSFCGRGSLSYAQRTPNKDSVPALFAFGDSVVDTGNNNLKNTLCKLNFPHYGKDFPGGKATGRFSDDKLPCDLAVEALGIKEFLPPYLDPSLQIDDLVTGVNFASSCSGFDPVTFYCRGFWWQIRDAVEQILEYFARFSVKTSYAPWSAYVFWDGAHPTEAMYETSICSSVNSLV